MVNWFVQFMNEWGFVTRKSYMSLVRELDKKTDKERQWKGLVDTLLNQIEDVIKLSDTSNEILQNELTLVRFDRDKYKNTLDTWERLIEIEQFLLSEKHDIRMEELVYNLKEQILDNPEWLNRDNYKLGDDTEDEAV